MLDKIVCHNESCRKIPSLIIDQNTPTVKIYCPEHEERILRIKDYINACEQGNNLRCSNCGKKAPLDNFIFYCNICKKYLDVDCFHRSNCSRKNHDFNKVKVESNENNCKHNKFYTKYCLNCKISLCNDCFIGNNIHRDHLLQDIRAKTNNELESINNILNKQEKIFNKTKDIINQYLEELENKLKLKRIIFQNYKKNKFNGNALNNLENLNININQEFYNKINSYFYKDYININNAQKALSLYYFSKMCGNIDNNINIEVKEENILPRINNINSNLNNNINNNISNIKKYSEDENNNEKNIINIHGRGKLIKSISENNKIYSLLVLNTGNIAVGFRNGIIKIYKTEFKNNNNLPILLTIDKFKGRRINYLYQLKDKTLLCCTYSKIHHIELTEFDTKYTYLGTIKLSGYELPKKIIELGDNLIVSLGEKKKKKKNKENLIKIKSILKIFKCNEQQDKNDEIMNDSDSINSMNSCSSWDSIFSNEEENEEDEDENKFQFYDERIKIYKKNKNDEKLYICSIFGTKTSSSESSFQFVASSNSLYDGGENKLVFYGIMNNPRKKGEYLIYLENEKIDKISCSKDIDSICFIEKNKIAIALQKYKQGDSDGIAIIDIKDKKLIKIINGLSLGIIKLNRLNNKKNIFFFTNNTKDIKKLDAFGIYEYTERKNLLEYDANNAICSLKKGCIGCAELKSNNNNKIAYYAIYTFNEIFILEIK